MDMEKLLRQYPRCVQNFTRDGYEEEYGRFTADNREALEALSESDADAFFAFAEKEAGARRFGKAARIFDLRIFLCVYLCPAAASAGTESAAAFAEAVRRLWNEKYPRASFELGSFEDIASGFRTKPFGL